MARLRLLLLLLAIPALARANGQWVLEKSTVAYHVSHPFHDTDGVSHAARGKAVCRSGECEVLVAAPVKSFDSADSNRDLHMLQVVDGAKYPLVSVRARVPESAQSPAAVLCDLQVEFAGKTATYPRVPFTVTNEGGERRISGTIPAKLSDFGIPPPSLLAVPVKDEMPVRVDTVWKAK
ncbi:MAG TPA: YceI family protein [Thermoanaerobaculia bacterium]|nr:YceI family protein [Thermoanaerobaculia bacterium]